MIAKTEIESIKHKIRNSFANIRFEKETHEYVLNGYKLESSSAYRKQFENEFENYFAADAKHKSALRNNPNTKLTAAYYRERWDLLGQEARVRGTRVHLYSETYPELEEPSCDKEKGVFEFYQLLNPEKYVLLFQELIMYDSEFYKAGTCDLLFLNLETGNLVIGDWKTNDKSIFSNYQNRNLKGSYNRFKDTSYNKYSMQMSHYKYMIEKATGLKVEETWLIWLTRSLKRVAKKGIKYQKIDPLFKGQYMRVFKGKDMTQKIASNLEYSKADILANLSKPTKKTKISTEFLNTLGIKLPEMPKIKMDFKLKKKTPDKPVKASKTNKTKSKSTIVDDDI